MSIKKVSEWEDQNTPDELFTADKANEISEAFQEVSETNLGHTGNMPLVSFTKDDWKNRPLGFRGFVTHTNSEGLPTDYWYYVERIGNRNGGSGYAWNAYPYNENGKVFFGTNSDPENYNDGLPKWKEIASSEEHTKIYTTTATATSQISNSTGKIGDLMISSNNNSGLAFIKVRDIAGSEFWKTF